MPSDDPEMLMPVIDYGREGMNSAITLSLSLSLTLTLSYSLPSSLPLATAPSFPQHTAVIGPGQRSSGCDPIDDHSRDDRRSPRGISGRAAGGDAEVPEAALAGAQPAHRRSHQDRNHTQIRRVFGSARSSCVSVCVGARL